VYHRVTNTFFGCVSHGVVGVNQADEFQGRQDQDHEENDDESEFDLRLPLVAAAKASDVLEPLRLHRITRITLCR
jgi:hypothetical protein